MRNKSEKEIAQDKPASAGRKPISAKDIPSWAGLSPQLLKELKKGLVGEDQVQKGGRPVDFLSKNMYLYNLLLEFLNSKDFKQEGDGDGGE